jgi:hypothetical protein
VNFKIRLTRKGEEVRWEAVQEGYTVPVFTSDPVLLVSANSKLEYIIEKLKTDQRVLREKVDKLKEALAALDDVDWSGTR